MKLDFWPFNRPTPEKRHTVAVNYKSGRQVIVTCTTFKTQFRGGALSEIEWSGMIPNPLFYGIDNIESVWEIRKA